MFGKLLKHEFKATGKWYGILFSILAIASILLGFMLSSIASGNINNQSANAIGIIYSFFSVVFFSTCTALIISNLVITVRRFYQNIYGREGYLTWTLPASSHQIILSKLLMAAFWYIASMVGIVLSLLLVASVIALNSGVDILSQLGFLFSYLPVVELLQLFFYFILSSTSGVLFLYFAISIGQLFQNHRVLMAFVAVFFLWIIFGSLNNIITGVNPFNYIFSTYYVGYTGATFSYFSAYTFEIIKCVIFYLGVYYITQTKLNLE